MTIHLYCRESVETARSDFVPRPVKLRKVEHMPKHNYFKPMGIPKCELEEVDLKVEELEAMRLKDIEGLSQEECAGRMHVSRQTFQNIIDSARKKVASALTKGMAIKIEGGNYTFNICKFRCLDCGHEFEKAHEKKDEGCPKCGSYEIKCIRKTDFCIDRCRKLRVRGK